MNEMLGYWSLTKYFKPDMRCLVYTAGQQPLSYRLLKEWCCEHSHEELMFDKLIWDKSTVENKEMDWSGSPETAWQ